MLPVKSQTDEKTQLSGRPAPLYRFAAEKHDILDGPLFTFGDSNDPEMLLLLEVVRDQPAAVPYWLLPRSAGRPPDSSR